MFCISIYKLQNVKYYVMLPNILNGKLQNYSSYLYCEQVKDELKAFHNTDTV